MEEATQTKIEAPTTSENATNEVQHLLKRLHHPKMLQMKTTYL